MYKVIISKNSDLPNQVYQTSDYWEAGSLLLRAAIEGKDQTGAVYKDEEPVLILSGLPRTGVRELLFQLTVMFERRKGNES